jgi:hypothetical protein
VTVRLPIDTSHLTFTCASPARPVIDFQTKRHKANAASGEPLFAVRIRVEHLDDVRVIHVKVAGDPTVRRGEALELDGLVASPWFIGGRHGVAFRARAIRAVTPPPVTTRNGRDPRTA